MRELSAIRGRVFTDPREHKPQVDWFRSIQLQCFHRRATGCRAADYKQRIIAPREVSRPTLVTRIEQRDESAAERVPTPDQLLACPKPSHRCCEHGGDMNEKKGPRHKERAKARYLTLSSELLPPQVAPGSVKQCPLWAYPASQLILSSNRTQSYSNRRTKPESNGSGNKSHPKEGRNLQRKACCRRSLPSCQQQGQSCEGLEEFKPLRETCPVDPAYMPSIERGKAHSKPLRNTRRPTPSL